MSKRIKVYGTVGEPHTSFFGDVSIYFIFIFCFFFFNINMIYKISAEVY